MYVRFDSLNRHEPLTIFLCNPGSVFDATTNAPTKSIGILCDTSDEELCLNFNQLSELNMRVTKTLRGNQYDDAHISDLYNAVQARRLLYVVGIGYFLISSAEKNYDEQGIEYKDIKAVSIESEFQNKKMPYIANGTYSFGEIMDSLISTMPLWTLDFDNNVDNAVAEKYRTFEDIDVNLNMLSFMLENIQEAYECIFVFDIIHRTIGVFDQNNYVRQTNIHLTKEDVIKNINISENTENLYTAISVVGDDNTTISAINPLGGNVIYNFDNYLDWMSDDLKTKVQAWQEAVEAAGNTEDENGYYKKNLSYYNKLQDLHNAELELQRLESLKTIYTRCRENIVAQSSVGIVSSYNNLIENNAEKISIASSISDTLSSINALIENCNASIVTQNDAISGFRDEIYSIESDIKTISENLRIEEYFEPEEYEELANYIFEGSYTDEYVKITDIMSYTDKFEQMKLMYDRAKKTLEKASKPTQEFKIDVENFLFAKEFEAWSEQLETGCVINVELEEGDVATLFLSNITVNYSDYTLSLTFGSRFVKFDPKSLFDNMLGKISKSANSLNFIKETVYPIKNGEFNKMKEALQTSRNLTMQAALTSDDEDVIIDGTGYTGMNKSTGERIKITGSNIVFTDDAWESCKTAIGKILLGDNKSLYGINAEAIIGNLIVGNNLIIKDNQGNDLFTVEDGRVRINISGMTNGKGYTFDENGLNINDENSAIQNQLDHTGMYVRRSDDTIILEANDNGVNAMNLNARNYLIVGTHCRFEEIDGGRTGCFYISGGGETTNAY